MACGLSDHVWSLEEIVMMADGYAPASNLRDHTRQGVAKMSLSKEWTDWHLTPRGWEAGSQQTDFGKETNIDPPEDRVLTSRFHEEISSRFSKPEKWHEEIWRSPDQNTIDALRSKFGVPPELI
jgi:hypothetical protein